MAEENTQEETLADVHSNDILGELRNKVQNAYERCASNMYRFLDSSVEYTDQILTQVVEMAEAKAKLAQEDIDIFAITPEPTPTYAPYDNNADATAAAELAAMSGQQGGYGGGGGSFGNSQSTGAVSMIVNGSDCASQIAAGLINTGVEGGTDAVSCSSNGDYPSIGCSQWEGGRADQLLSMIPGGSKFIGRTFSDIDNSGQLGELSALLDSPQGQQAQMQLLASDTSNLYVETLGSIPNFTNKACMVYAGIWCPTSHTCVSGFIKRCADRGYDINNLAVLSQCFENEYYQYAEVGEEYAEGYAGRAQRTYQYVASNIA